jgi:hypothetical protein
MARSNHTKVTTTPPAENDTGREDHVIMIKNIRSALLIGLASFGEVDRLTNRAAVLESYGDALPDGMRPIHPTMCHETVGEFAEALRALDLMEEMPLAG